VAKRTQPYKLGFPKKYVEKSQGKKKSKLSEEEAVKLLEQGKEAARTGRRLPDSYFKKRTMITGGKMPNTKADNDPSKDAAKNKSKTARIMGLPSQRVYTGIVPKARQDFSDPSKLGEQYHHKGDLVAPAYNIHKTTGLYRKGHGQVSRPVDPTKRGKKGSVKGSDTKKLAKGGKVARKALSAATKKTLQAKAKKSGKSYGTLAKVYRRGQGAWISSGSRRGMPMAAWAMGRVNSFLRGSRKHDTDLR